MLDDGVLWPQIVSAGEVVYPPGGTLGPRSQQYLQLVFIHSGDMSVWVDGVRYDAGTGSATILFPGHEERFVFAEDRETWHSWIHLYIPQLPCEAHNRLSALPRTLPLSPAMTELINHMLILRNSPLPTLPAMLKAMGVQVLYRYIGEGERQLAGEGDAITHPAVEQAQQFIRSHLNEALSLNQIAQAAAVTPAHLIRLFRAHCGKTPMAYVWDQRVAMGIELLERTGLAVGVIAARCGFQTSYHFSRRIRQATGLSPLDVRRRSWQRQ